MLDIRITNSDPQVFLIHLFDALAIDQLRFPI